MNKTALITGATSGIGRATAHEFAKHGINLILCGRRQERLDIVKKALERETDVHNLNFDVRDKEAVKNAIESLPKEFQQIDILINNAGNAHGLDPIQDGSLEDWDAMMDINVKGLLYMSKYVIPQMTERKSGHIINIGSSAGKEVYPKGNVYCATKHAVAALTRSMRLDLHTHKIKVSQVSPAHVEQTEFALVRFDGDEKKSKIYDDFVPLNSKDVAETIYFIASRPKHVNIQDIMLMGTQQASSNFIDRSGRS